MYCGRWADWPSPCWSALLLCWQVYALLGRLDRLVLLGAVFGWILAVGNFLSLSITVSNALDRAANGGSPQKAQLEIQTSSVVRPLVLALIYIVLFRAKVCDPVAALLPLLFAQVAIRKHWNFSGMIKKAVILHHEWP